MDADDTLPADAPAPLAADPAPLAADTAPLAADSSADAGTHTATHTATHTGGATAPDTNTHTHEGTNAMHEPTLEARLRGASSRLTALLDPPAPAILPTATLPTATLPTATLPTATLPTADDADAGAASSERTTDRPAVPADPPTLPPAAQRRATHTPHTPPPPRHGSQRRLWYGLSAAAVAALVVGGAVVASKRGGESNTFDAAAATDTTAAAALAPTDTASAPATSLASAADTTAAATETTAAAASETIAAAAAETIPASGGYVQPPGTEAAAAAGVADASGTLGRAANGAPAPAAKAAAPGAVPAPAVALEPDASEEATAQARDASRRVEVPPATYPQSYPTTTIPFAPRDLTPYPGLPGATLTSADAQSTFGLDVDTAAWTRLRERLRTTGSYDPAEVRTEELLNSFNQDYPSPQGDDTFAIHTDGAAVAFLPSDVRVLRVGIQAKRIPETQRKPASLTFVIDVSGSMEEGGKLELVKQSITTMLNRLDSGDRIAIVAFSDTAWVALPPTSGADRARVLSALQSLRPTDSTNAEAGLVIGYDLAKQMFRNDAINRVVLASDGVANVGPTGPDQILQTIRERARGGIGLITIGVGSGSFNDQMMERLADQGDGFYTYVDGPQQAEKVFGERLFGSLQVVARNAKVQVTFDRKKVFAYRLLGYENRAVADSQFRNDHVDAGEIGAGHAVTALYEVQLLPGASGSLAEVALRWTNPNGKAGERSADIETSSLAPDLASAAPRLQQDVYVAAWAENLRGAPWATRVDVGTLAARFGRVAAMLPEDRDIADLSELMQRTAGTYVPPPPVTRFDPPAPVTTVVW